VVAPVAPEAAALADPVVLEPTVVVPELTGLSLTRAPCESKDVGGVASVAVPLAPPPQP
jgi:hypothetical protein